MIKRLFKKWLKRQVMKVTNDWDKTFEWIYGSPISTWRDKLFCIRHNSSIDIPKRAYKWLSGNMSDTEA